MSESFNTKYYPIYRASVSMMAWLPVFFMYFNESLDIKDVLLLESIYYISVVFLEVPSGYFSDKIGRKITLVISSLGFAAGYLIFGLFEPKFEFFCLGQIALAIGMSFMSGTNTAFYYESLQEVGLESKFAEKEASVGSITELTSAFAVLFGGFIGALKLKYAYLLSFLFIVPGLIISFLFKEPKVEHENAEGNIFSQLKIVFTYLRNEELKWVFVFSVILYILTHIPYEFYQPYLKLLGTDSYKISIHAAIYSGIIFALTRVFGSIAAARSVKLRDRFGLKSLCWTSLIFQILLIGLMGLILSPWVMPFILLRGVSMSLVRAPLNAEIAPRTGKEARASYFSIQSLVSRLSFSLTLVFLSISVGTGIHNDWPALSKILISSTIGLSLLSLALIFISSGSLFQSKPNSSS